MVDPRDRHRLKVLRVSPTTVVSIECSDLEWRLVIISSMAGFGGVISSMVRRLCWKVLTRLLTIFRSSLPRNEAWLPD